MYDSRYLLEAAKSIRPFLEELLDSEAYAVDAQLANLIARYNMGESVDDLIIQLLHSYDETREWIEQFFEDSPKRFSSLPGDPTVPSAPKYDCPLGKDYTWYRFDSSEPIPICPTHKIKLQLVRLEDMDS